MMPIPRRRIRTLALPRWAAATAVAAAVGCGAGNPTSPPDGAFRVANGLGDSVLVIAADLETAALLDLALSIPATTLSERVVAPGRTGTLPTQAVMGYHAGSTVRFFVYRVQLGVARYAASITRTSAQLAARGFQVDVTMRALDP